MSKLGTGINKLDVDYFLSSTRSSLNQSLTDGYASLLGPNNSSLNHNPVVLDNTISNKSTHWCNALVGKIVLGCARFFISSLSDSVDLLVALGTVMVTKLSSTWNSGSDASWMPTSNTCNLAKTLMSLSRKTGNTKTGDNSSKSLTTGNTNGINHLVLVKHGVKGELLLEETLAEFDLVLGASSVHLDLHDVSLLLAKVKFVVLGVRDQTDNGAMLDNASQFSLNIFASIFVLLGVLGVCLLL
mmetsp:Transcript_16584/g.26910  ORF Transcript_16584/g.26910 Transcript_16584/m.26910 type:complete len:243 (-) Transcript_16584:709-1437(-)